MPNDVVSLDDEITPVFCLCKLATFTDDMVDRLCFFRRPILFHFNARKLAIRRQSHVGCSFQPKASL